MMSPIAREAMHLIEAHRWAALATLRDGEPLASMVAYAVAPGRAALLFLAGQSAPHTRSLLDCPRASLAITEPDDHEGDPYRLQRITLSGRAAVLQKTDPAFFSAAEQYVDRFPEALPRLELGEFVLFRFVPDEARYVGGPARSARFTWTELTAGADIG
jgi:putative heme iron utilization protein